MSLSHSWVFWIVLSSTGTLLIIVLLQLPSSPQGAGSASLIQINGVGQFSRHRRGMSGARIRDRVIIDGAHGEGGGQILGTALSLSAITGRPLRIERIRAARRNPGFAGQHLTELRAAAAICSAQLSGDGSTSVQFAPEGPVVDGITFLM
jgi:hypothetical protein